MTNTRIAAYERSENHGLVLFRAISTLSLFLLLLPESGQQLR